MATFDTRRLTIAVEDDQDCAVVPGVDPGLSHAPCALVSETRKSRTPTPNGRGRLHIEDAKFVRDAPYQNGHAGDLAIALDDRGDRGHGSQTDATERASFGRSASGAWGVR